MMYLTHMVWCSSEGFSSFYETQNVIFLVLYWLEALLKITAFGWRYFYDRWNWLDIVVCLGSTIAESSFPGVDVRYFRFFRVLRIVRLFRKYSPVS